jgi:hypothetical protein
MEDWNKVDKMTRDYRERRERRLSESIVRILERSHVAHSGQALP